MGTRMAGEDGKAAGRRASSSSDTDLARRLDRLSRDLDAERRERAEEERPARAAGANYAQGFRLASEFVAGILVGAAIGWGIDYFAGTSPWGMIGFLLLGFAAGVLNVVRAAGQMSSTQSSGPDDRTG
jgi:ATP synthase protein I